MRTNIHSTSAEVALFITEVIQRGDSEREALGFLPRSAYSEAASKGNLYVATVQDGKRERYAGHILFGGRFPHLKIFQVYVEPVLRHEKIGRKLVDRLVSYAEQLGYLTVSARVATDLPANEFWEQAGFQIARTENGGTSTGRRINIRVRELENPTLFRKSEISAAMVAPMHSEQPIYLLDVNVFLDVLKDRPRARAAKRLITAALSGILRLFVAEEFAEELERASTDPSTDTVLRLAKALPQFPAPPQLILQTLTQEVSEIVFPGQPHPGLLRPQQTSDLRHLATAIYHKAAGFVTSDEAILKKNAELHRKYDLYITGPAELAELYLPDQWTPATISAVAHSGTAIELVEMPEARRTEVEDFLTSCGWSKDQIQGAVSVGQSACPRRRTLVSYGGPIVAFMSWEPPRPPRSQCTVWFGLAALHPMSDLAADALLDTLARDICATRPASATLYCDTRSKFVTATAIARGFVQTGTTGRPLLLERFCIGAVISSRNWEINVVSLSRELGVRLPATPPSYCGPGTPLKVGFDGRELQQVHLSDFETSFAPVILYLPDRPVVVVPIQRPYADQLLDTSEQLSLLPRPEASLWRERLYLCSPRALSVLSAGTIILFYESKGQNDGRGAIVAIAQIVRTAIRKKNLLDAAMTRKGVLSSAEISTLSVTEDSALVYFDQLFRFERPVAMSRLRELKCMDGANFVTARQIKASAALAIIEEGQPSVRLA